jgi:hypothetical protein
MMSQRNMLPTFSVLKNKTKHEAYKKLATCFEREVGSDTFLQNVSWHGIIFPKDRNFHNYCENQT